jgi:hypothetical protein
MFDKSKKQKNKLSDKTAKTLGDRIVAWFKKDWNKKHK